MHRYIIFNKPFDVLSQFTGEKDQKTLSLFNLPEAVYAAGRLDKDSEGLLILTNDGPFIKKFLDPDSAHKRTYLVQVEGQPKPKDLLPIQEGLRIKNYLTKPAYAEIIDEPKDLWEREVPIRFRKNKPTSWLKIQLTEGKNRQVRKMTAAIGFPTLRLIRSSMGNISLDHLEVGKWREVLRNDII